MINEPGGWQFDGLGVLTGLVIGKTRRIVRQSVSDFNRHDGVVEKAPVDQANAKVVTWLQNFEIASELLDSLERVLFNED